MSTRTTIEWARNADGTPGRSWNPVSGCSRISEGCDLCYAETIAHRFAGTAGFPNGFEVTLRRGRPLEEPLRWRKPTTVFVNSMSDLFHADIPDGFIGSVFEVMAKTPQHTYLILTKRPGRMRSLLTRWGAEGAKLDWAGPGTAVFRRDDQAWVGPVAWPLPNVRLGVSTENQHWANVRIPLLRDTPAAVRWISAEPLIGPIDLTGDREFGLDWVVVGGETGAGARTMRLDWARSLVQQCRDAGVPVFVKQLGEAWARDTFVGGEPVARHNRKGSDPQWWPSDLRVREFPGDGLFPLPVPAPVRYVPVPAQDVAQEVAR